MASLRIEKDSMVSGAMLLSIWAVTSTPSTMYNGDCPLPNVDMPRIQNVAPSATPVVNIPEDLSSPSPPPPPAGASSYGGGMPTITVRERVVKPQSLPSVYRPEDIN